jgi:hypothetical protein
MNASDSSPQEVQRKIRACLAFTRVAVSTESQKLSGSRGTHTDLMIAVDFEPLFEPGDCHADSRVCQVSPAAEPNSAKRIPVKLRAR